MDDQVGGEARPSVSGPSTVTALVARGRREGRYDVEVDGEAVATVSAGSVTSLKLAVGRQLDEREFSALLAEGAIIAAYDRALNILGFRDRSATELRRALLRKGVEPGPATVAVDRLQESGLVDDGRYARALARSRALNAGVSRRRIEQDLARRGVRRDIAEEAISEVWEEEEVDQTAAAIALARKRAPSLAGLDPASRRRRLYGFLARRGYSSEEIRKALSVALEELASDGDVLGGSADGTW